ncbi:hypothetical protein EGW08_006937 [Elysia chlorotica]|uniref:Uncharacterized protein n=1 Tax=Elysia chlorotica TaxID=188477 RepID=A0A433TUN7_ELYCH|nr:hypothetical protein EGW08_006937 [Elysia chlorotica]
MRKRGYTDVPTETAESPAGQRHGIRIIQSECHYVCTVPAARHVGTRHGTLLSRQPFHSGRVNIHSVIRAIQVFQQLLYADPGFKRASEVHLRLALMFKVLKQYDTSLKHFKLTLADSNPCISPQPEIRLHIAHLYEVQGKYKQAKEAYETFIQTDQLTPALKAAGLRQLGGKLTQDFPGLLQSWLSHAFNSQMLALSGRVVVHVALGIKTL